MLSTAKHFPGHGDTATDSHISLPVIPHDRAHLESVELVPFRAAIAAGVDSIMTAHVLFPRLDRHRPATLSPDVMDLLRGELGFDGVVFSDDLGLTEAVGGWLGAELAAVGVTLDLGPVADVNSNPDNPVIGTRSFGTDPARVAAHAAAWTRGLQATGVAACAKHFPGHGDTATDSHLALPTIEVDEATLAARGSEGSSATSAPALIASTALSTP